MRLMTLPNLALSCLLLSMGSAHAVTSGTLTINGSIGDTTCSLAAGDINKTVSLPELRPSDLRIGNLVGNTTFEISATCQYSTSATFTFAGTPDLVAPSLFKNTDTDGVNRNVGIGFYSAIGGVISPIAANDSAANRSRTIIFASGKAILPLGGGYQLTGGTATAGKVSTQITVKMAYQ